MLSRSAREIYNLSFRAVRRISFSFFALLASFAIPAFAQTTPVITNVTGVHTQLCNVFSLTFWILISISMIMIMWAAYLYVTAQDDAEKASEARRTIFYAAIGIIVALLARGFPILVASVFSGGTTGLQGC